MSPSLGNLPSNEPAPTGVGQIKRGVADVYMQWYNGVSVRPLDDGGGNYMRIYVTPPRPGWWVIRAESIWSTPDAVWTYFHWGVRLSQADANGYSEDRNHVAVHSYLGWIEQVINTAYRLNAGVAYYAEMYWPNASMGYYNQYWCGKEFLSIMGEFIEDGT